MITEDKRNLVNIVAGNYMTEQDQGDCYDAYVILRNIVNTNEGDKHLIASNEVDMAEAFEDLTIAQVIDLIECGVFQYETAEQKHPEFLMDLDFSELRNQKYDVVKTIEDLEYDAKEAGKAGEEGLEERLTKQVESLTGLLHLIDAIQDHAVDNMGIDEKTVFNLSDEDE